MKAALVIVIAGALALGACGRRGSGEIPESAQGLPTGERFPSDPNSTKVPDRSFILDPILQ